MISELLLTEVKIISNCLALVQTNEELTIKLGNNIVLESMLFCALAIFRYLTVTYFIKFKFIFDRVLILSKPG
jgi:hypothetical protein